MLRASRGERSLGAVATPPRVRRADVHAAASETVDSLAPGLIVGSEQRRVLATQKRGRPMDRAAVRPCLCAVLCTVGSACGWIAVHHELALQMPVSSRAGVLAVGLIGFVAGLWAPRRFLRRRLVYDWSPEGDAATPADDRKLAETIAGLALLMLGLFWVAVTVVLELYETYRGSAVRSALLPGSLVRVVLVAPATVVSFVGGALSAVTATAVLAWARRVWEPRPRHSHMLMLAAACATLGALIVSPAFGALSAAIALLVAAATAVGRRSTEPRNTALVPHSSAGPRGDSVLALSVFLLAGLTMIGGPIIALDSAGAFGRSLAIVFGMFGLILCMPRGWLASRYARDVGVLLLLPVSAILAVAAPDAFWPLLPTAGAAAYSVACVGARALACGASGPTALYRAGVLLGTGAAAGAAVLVLGDAAAGFSLQASRLMAALLSTGAAGLLLIIDRRLTAATRVIGLTATGLWLMVLPGLSRATWSPEASAGLPDELAAGREVISRLLAPTTDRLAAVSLANDASGAEQRLAFDLVHPPPDAVLFVDGAFARDAAIWAPRLARRAFDEAGGGRRPVVLELPASSPALRAFARAAFRRGLPGYQLRIDVDSAGASEVAYAVFAADLEQRLRRSPRSIRRRVSLEPLRTDVTGP